MKSDSNEVLINCTVSLKEKVTKKDLRVQHCNSNNNNNNNFNKDNYLSVNVFSTAVLIGTH